MAFSKSVGILAAFYASGALASCAYGTSLFPRAEEGTVKVNTFGYTGAIGPANWHLLDAAANAKCTVGAHQTPINMINDVFSVIPAADLGIDIPDFAEGAEFENLGTTVEVVAKGGNMTFEGMNFSLAQFHFHLPSEHLDNGLSMAMEMHMVWEGPEGQLAVVGAFIDIADTAEGAAAVPAAPAAPEAPAAPATPTPLIPIPVFDKPGAAAESAHEDPAVAHSPMGRIRHARRKLAKEQAAKRQEGEAPPAAPAALSASTVLETIFNSVDQISAAGTVVKTAPLVMSEVVSLINSGSFQTYSGSLTTPPCSEGVRWLVSDQKLAVNLSTFKKARSVIGFNARFPQNFLGGGQPALPAVAA